jgi:hypothetical protein
MLKNSQQRNKRQKVGGAIDEDDAIQVIEERSAPPPALPFTITAALPSSSSPSSKSQASVAQAKTPTAAAAAAPTNNTVTLYCKNCSQSTTVYQAISRSEKNPNRAYYKCPANHFVAWVDECNKTPTPLLQTGPAVCDAAETVSPAARSIVTYNDGYTQRPAMQPPLVPIVKVPDATAFWCKDEQLETEKPMPGFENNSTSAKQPFILADIIDTFCRDVLHVDQPWRPSVPADAKISAAEWTVAPATAWEHAFRCVDLSMRAGAFNAAIISCKSNRSPNFSAVSQ